MKEFIDALCSDACAGRATASAGGALARSLVMDGLRAAGLDPFTQDIPVSGGQNVLATIPGDVDRWVLVAAHYDHLGREGDQIFRGADDNAAAVAILVEVAKGLASKRADGRGVIIAAFDAEEPPHFLTAGMGSQHFVSAPTVPLDRIDMMVCMDLVGHALGDGAVPSEVGETMFALGSERSAGTSDRVRALARAEPGVIVRPADAQIVPKLSDYAAFWAQKRPFLFLTGGRSRRYHTVDDTPEHVDMAKVGATARWLERFVRDTCARDASPFVFHPGRDDGLTLDALVEMLAPLAEVSPEAEAVHARARALRGRVRADRTLPDDGFVQLQALVRGIESSLG